MTGMDIADADSGGTPRDGVHPGDPDFTPIAAISATMQPSVNVAFWQNHVPVLTELTLATNSEEAAGDVTINFTCEPPVIGPRSWHLQGVTKGVRVVDDLDLTLDGKMLARLTEGTRAIASFNVRRRGEESIVAERHCDIRVLARNEWGGSAGIPDILVQRFHGTTPITLAR